MWARSPAEYRLASNAKCAALSTEISRGRQDCLAIVMLEMA